MVVQQYQIFPLVLLCSRKGCVNHTWSSIAFLNYWRQYFKVKDIFSEPWPLHWIIVLLFSNPEINDRWCYCWLLVVQIRSSASFESCSDSFGLVSVIFSSMQPLNLQLSATAFVDSIDNSITEPIYNTMASLATLAQCQSLQFLYSHNLHSTCIIYRTQDTICSLLCSTDHHLPGHGGPWPPPTATKQNLYNSIGNSHNLHRLLAHANLQH